MAFFHLFSGKEREDVTHGEFCALPVYFILLDLQMAHGPRRKNARHKNGHSPSHVVPCMSGDDEVASAGDPLR